MFEARVQGKIDKLLKSNMFQFVESGNKVVLDEKKSQGEAELTIKFNNPVIIPKDFEKFIQRFDYVENSQCADYAIIEDNNGVWVLHIIEFKRTVNQTKWNKCKIQFQGAIAMSKAICGILDINIDDIICYTAYVNENFKMKNTTAPAMLKLPLGKKTTNAFEEWKDESFILDLGDEMKIQLNKIKLNLEKKEGIDVGVGEYEL